MKLRLLAVLAGGMLLMAGCNLAPVTPTPLPTNTPIPLPTINPGLNQLPLATQPPPNPNCASTPAGWIPYVVEAGDSLGLLASQTESTVDELTVGNCLQTADSILLGDTIYLPRQPVISP